MRLKDESFNKEIRRLKRSLLLLPKDYPYVDPHIDPRKDIHAAYIAVRRHKRQTYLMKSRETRIREKRESLKYEFRASELS